MMNLRKHGPRVLGLSLFTALGLMAFSASAAQAAAGSFLINGSLANLLATFTGGLIGGTGTLLVEELGVEILCTGVTMLAGSEIINASEGLASLRYEGCEYLITGSLPSKVKPGKDCTILGDGVVGWILVKAILRPILIGSQKLLILAEGDLTGGTGTLGSPLLALITSHKCNIPNHIEITGTTVLKLLADDVAKQELVEAPEGLRLLTGKPIDQIFFGFNNALLDGEAYVELTGNHLGKTWGSE